MKTKTTGIFLILSTVCMALSAGTLVKAEFDDVIPFIYAEHSSPSGFDPQNFYDSTSRAVAINHLEGLYALNYSDPTLGIVPRLAEDMGQWNAEGTEWTIPLRDDVKWHDGSKFKADDVKWNWDRLNNLAAEGLSQHSGLWFNDDGGLILKETIVVDKYTIKFILNKPWMDFFYMQSFAGSLMIKPIEGKDEILIENDKYDMLIGTGPFVLDDYVSGEKTVLVANNDYYRGAPDIQKLIFQVYESSTESNNALMAHECHVDSYIRTDNRMAFAMDVDLEYFIQGGSCCYFYHLNVNNIDWAVRKAIQYAFDYEYTNTILYENNLFEHHSPIPDGILGYNPNSKELPYYNLSLARQFLINDPYYGPLVNARVANISDDQAWKDVAINNPLAIHTFTHYGTATLEQLIENMENIGVRVEDKIVEDWAVYLSENSEELEIVMGRWCPNYRHPINQVEPIFKTNGFANYNGLANATIDTLMSEAHTITGEELETKMDEIVTAIIMEQAAAMYWSQNLYITGWSANYVSNVGDLLNHGGEKYFYNVQFALSEGRYDYHYGPSAFEMVIFMVIVIIVCACCAKIFKKPNKSRKPYQITENTYNVESTPYKKCVICGHRQDIHMGNYCGECGHRRLITLFSHKKKQDQ